MDERTIKAFHDSDFSVPANQWQSVFGRDLFSGTEPDGNPLIGFAWVPLFDGTSNASILTNFGGGGGLFGGTPKDAPENPPGRLLLSVGNPQIGQAGAALVGRWFCPQRIAWSQNSAADSKGLEGIALTLKVDYADATSALVIAHLVDGNGVADKDKLFRLPIESHAQSSISRLSLMLTTAWSVPLILEDLRLVEPNVSIPQPSPSPTAGLPPANLVPTSSSVISSCDFDPMMNGQSGVDPVVVVLQEQERTLQLFRRPADGSLRRISIASLDAPPVSAGDFGVTGTIHYAGLDGSSDFDGLAYFELTAWFPDGTSRIVGTTAPFGPCQKISNHSGDRPMQLAMHSPMQPTRLQLQLVSDGIGRIGFSNLSFVQFIPPPVVAATSSLPPRSRWSDARLVRTAGWTTVLAALLLSIAAVQLPNRAAVRNGIPIVSLLAGEILFAWAMFLLGKGGGIADVAPLFAGAIASILPLLARQLVFRRLHRRELRKMLTIDAV